MESLQAWLAAIGGLIVVIAYAAYVLRAQAADKRKQNESPLMDCPDCGGRVSTRAVSCPHCGRPMQ